MRWGSLVLVIAIGVTACATIPTGPTVMVLPGQGKSFESFQADSGICRQWAAQEAGVTPEKVSGHALGTGAAAGTVLGAGLGAAIGAASGNPGVGAAIGAGSGLLGGTAIGYGAGQAAAGSVQWRYDIAYEQCMYAKGNQIPVVMAPSRAAAPAPPPPPAPSNVPPSAPPSPPPH